MKCSEIMQQNVFSMELESTLHDVARQMRRRGLDFVPVCGVDKRPLGALSDIEVAERVLAEDWDPGMPITEVMTANTATCSADDDVITAQRIMLARHVSRLICLGRTGEMAGVISLADLAQYLAYRQCTAVDAAS